VWHLNGAGQAGSPDYTFGAAYVLELIAGCADVVALARGHSPDQAPAAILPNIDECKIECSYAPRMQNDAEVCWRPFLVVVDQRLLHHVAQGAYRHDYLQEL
jgi:hypothetical protein